MRPYPSYKNSGVEWIGEIPKHWDKIKTNLITENLDGKRVPLNSEQRSSMEGDIPYWGSNGVVDYINDFLFDEELVLVGEDGSPFFNRFKDVSFFVSGEVWINNHIHILKPKSNVIPKYLTHSFNCVDYKEFITGSTRDKLTQSDLSRIPHFIPPLPEQKQIVSFLDYKTQKIDELIEKTEQKIDLLKEKRTSLINHCVTKGLNPNVEMKDSGVEWIGEIPSHWKITRLKYLSQIINGSTPKSGMNEYWGGEIIWVTPNDLGKLNGNKITDSLKKITQLGLNSCGTTLTPKNSIILSTRAPIGHLGITKTETCTNQGCRTIVPDSSKCGNNFLFYYLYVSKDVLRSLGQGSTFLELSSQNLKDFINTLPPLPEQHQIVEYLDEQTQEIDSTIENETKRIELLKEYRQSLISEVVTGKIDVRDWKE